ncbi:MAG: cation transporter [Verrucomicrobiota bacterium]|nr:cation transporter [Verrucomicrobiota bacterium]
MKVLSFVSLAILVLSAAGFIGSRSLRAQSPNPAAQTETPSVVIPVKGMSCMACVAKTKQSLRAVPGVAEVEIKLSPGSATVKYDRSKVTPEKLVGVINDLGYQAGAPASKPAK